MNYKKLLKLESEKNIFDFSNKSKNIDMKIGYMLSRTQSMFEYKNLPDTIPARKLELYLQGNGNVCITEITESDLSTIGKRPRMPEPGLYAFFGGMGGELDAYYMPTIYTVANPYLNYSKNLVIDEDCIVIPSDSMYMGLLPMFEKYATALSENELSMYIAMINTRITSLLSASDDSTKKSAEKYMEDIKSGKLGIVSESAFLEGLKAQPYGNSGTTNTIQNLIELQQYLRAVWFNDLGLNANYNMKRESLNSSESQLNDDALLPLVDDMLRCRKLGIEKVNTKYGTNISVELASSWQDNAQEVELKHEEMEKDPEPDNLEEVEGGEENEPDETN